MFYFVLAEKLVVEGHDSWQRVFTAEGDVVQLFFYG